MGGAPCIPVFVPAAARPVISRTGKPSRAEGIRFMDFSPTCAHIRRSAFPLQSRNSLTLKQPQPPPRPLTYGILRRQTHQWQNHVDQRR